jgi:hypothetical protein
LGLNSTAIIWAAQSRRCSRGKRKRQTSASEVSGLEKGQRKIQCFQEENYEDIFLENGFENNKNENISTHYHSIASTKTNARYRIYNNGKTRKYKKRKAKKSKFEKHKINSSCR